MSNSVVSNMLLISKTKTPKVSNTCWILRAKTREDRIFFHQFHCSILSNSTLISLQYAVHKENQSVQKILDVSKNNVWEKHRQDHTKTTWQVDYKRLKTMTNTIKFFWNPKGTLFLLCLLTGYTWSTIPVESGSWCADCSALLKYLI